MISSAPPVSPAEAARILAMSPGLSNWTTGCGLSPKVFDRDHRRLEPDRRAVRRVRAGAAAAAPGRHLAVGIRSAGTAPRYSPWFSFQSAYTPRFHNRPMPRLQHPQLARVQTVRVAPRVHTAPSHGAPATGHVIQGRAAGRPVRRDSGRASSREPRHIRRQKLATAFCQLTCSWETYPGSSTAAATAPQVGVTGWGYTSARGGDMRTRLLAATALSLLWGAMATAQAPATQDQPGLKWPDEQIAEGRAPRPRRPQAHAQGLAERRARRGLPVVRSRQLLDRAQPRRQRAGDDFRGGIRRVDRDPADPPAPRQIQHPGLVLRAGGVGADAPRDDAGHRQERPARGRAARLDSRESDDAQRSG